MYQVLPVLPAFDSELFDPYSPGAMSPSMVGVFHCARTGAAAKNTIVKTRARLNPARRISSSQIVWLLNGWKFPRMPFLCPTGSNYIPVEGFRRPCLQAENWFALRLCTQDRAGASWRNSTGRGCPSVDFAHFGKLRLFLRRGPGADFLQIRRSGRCLGSPGDKELM